MAALAESEAFADRAEEEPLPPPIDPLLRSHAWREALSLAIVSRVALILVALGATWLLSDDTSGLPDIGFLDMWDNWDAEHFLTIAEHGYTSAESDHNAAAFFPLFPLCVRALMLVGLSPVIGGLLVSAIASVVAGAFLYRLVGEEMGPEGGRRALLYLFLFPTAIFLVAPYSEPLFLAGAIAAFYYARRGRWHLVGLPTAVAMGARAAGLFLIIGLVLEFVRGRDYSFPTAANAALALMVGLLPLLAYGAFLSQAMGDPFAFLTAQREGWGRVFVGPVRSFLNTFNAWDPGFYQTNWLMAWRIEIAAGLTGVAFTIWALVKREWGYAGFMGSMLALLLTSTWYYSVPRMLLSMFPIPILLAATSLHRPRLHEGLLALLTCLAALGAVVYTQGKWFF